MTVLLPVHLFVEKEWYVGKWKLFSYVANAYNYPLQKNP